MKKCTNCESLQEEGKFCAKCGGETIDVNKEAPTNEEQTDDSHAGSQAEPAKEATEKASNNVKPAHQEGAAVEAQVNNPQASGIDVKEVSTEYWNYFIRLFKNPTEALEHTENEFINGIINIILYAVTFAIGIYYTINALDTITGKEISYYLLDNEQGMPFFPIFIRVAIIAVVALACTFICITIIEKVFVKQLNFKQQLTQYAGLLTPFIVVNLLTVLTGLGGSFGFTISLAMLSLFTTTIIYGVIFIYDKVTRYRSSPYRVYAAVGIYIANLLLIYILLRMFIVQKVGELLEFFSYL